MAIDKLKKPVREPMLEEEELDMGEEELDDEEGFEEEDELPVGGLEEASDEELWEEMRARGLSIEEYEEYMSNMEEGSEEEELELGEEDEDEELDMEELGI